MTTAPDLVAGGRAEEVAVGFVDTLRRSGLEVSLTSSRLYVAALAEVGLADPAAVYWAGRATLVHRPEDVEIHDRAFVAYWGRLPVALRWRPPGEPERLTLAVDDPDGLPGNTGDPAPADDTVTVRYSATEVLTRKDFALYSDDELAEAHELMARIRLRGEHRPSRRRLRSPRHRGPLDLRRTVRDALRAGGEPVRLRRRRRAERPRRLVLLLDVSGSMEPYARALIRFVHAAVAGRTRVEAFALGTRLTRLTRELSQRDPDRALEAAAEAVVDWSGGTRLGEALARFNDEWGCRGMARGAVVVILSDGWDRGEPAVMDEQMRRLHRVAHRVVWVNPLKATPGYAPLARGMAAALPHVDEFIEGHSIESLEHLADVVLGRADGRDRPDPAPAGTGPDAASVTADAHTEEAP
ncbi:MAG: VWA domain-containing protein [Actinomyces sp.]|nr:MAG: VWA domain-containing protein [Actinomyces sp.]